MNKVLRKININNRAIVSGSLIIVILMAMLTYASVPLYNLFCRVTGFGGKTQNAIEKDLPPVNVMFLYDIINKIGELSDRSQQVGHRISLIASR